MLSGRSYTDRFIRPDVKGERKTKHGNHNVRSNLPILARTSKTMPADKRRVQLTTLYGKTTPSASRLRSKRRTARPSHNLKRPLCDVIARRYVSVHQATPLHQDLLPVYLFLASWRRQKTFMTKESLAKESAFFRATKEYHRELGDLVVGVVSYHFRRNGK